jgi:extracellular factor (EF) 3-hydroxypalmitic acid methyl ester biosynthesis protein
VSAESSRSHEKRLRPRKQINPKEKAHVEITLPYPRGMKIVKEILDMSEKGLSFRMPVEEGSFLPGTPLHEVTVLNGGKPHKTTAEVIYVTKFSGNEGLNYRVGIQLKQDNSKRALLSRKSFPERPRPQRYDARTAGNITKLVSFKDVSGNEQVGVLANFSKYGIAFELQENNLIFRISDAIENFRVIINDQLVYHGKVTIVNLRETAGRLLVGTTLNDAWLDVEKIFFLEKKADVENDFQQFHLTLRTTDKVDYRFKALTADIRFCLENLKKKLDDEEAKIQDESLENKLAAEGFILKAAESATYERIDSLLTSVDRLIKDFSEEEHAIHKSYFQQHVLYLLLLSPFIHRVYTKPLGYAGDYEMMKMIYRNNYEGASLYAKFMNKYTCYIPPAQANRNRIPYLLKAISSTVSGVTQYQSNANIMSVGCGPAIEVQEFIRQQNKNTDRCHFTLVDYEPEVLFYCQEKVLELKAELKASPAVNYLNKSVRELIKEAPVLKKKLPKQDLIYSSGLFEYLTDSTCARLIEIMMGFLNEKGRLIIGNYGPANKYRCYMEYGGEWYCLHRSKRDMTKLADGLTARKIYCETDPTKIINFLVIEK